MANDTPDLTYSILLSKSHPSTITVRDGTGRPHTLTAVHPGSGQGNRSPAPDIASSILADYFQRTDHITPDAAADRAFAHRAALSRVISSRLSHATGPVTVSAADIARHLLKNILSPPTDRYIHRYSVPSSNGDTTYTVAERDDGEWTCSCPRWKFKRESCKHIAAAQANPDWYPYEPPRRKA